MYDNINLKDELSGMYNEIENIAYREIEFNGEPFMMIFADHDKTEGYYQIGYTYSSEYKALKSSDKVHKLLYRTYDTEEEIMKVFNEFTVTEDDIEMFTGNLDKL